MLLYLDHFYFIIIIFCLFIYFFNYYYLRTVSKNMRPGGLIIWRGDRKGYFVLRVWGALEGLIHGGGYCCGILITPLAGSNKSRDLYLSM